MSKSTIQENFYKRLKHLGGVKTSNNPSSSLSTSTLVDYTRSNEGVALGIVKENHNYFIKTSSSKDETLGAEHFTYIGGIENKFKYQYNTLAEAEKNRNFYIKTLNESASKKFKTISLNEGENIAKAQPNADAVKAEKAQGEADKGKGSAPLKDTAPEKEPASVPAVKEIVVDKTQVNPKTVDDTKSGGKVTIVNKQATAKVVKENFGQEEELPAAEPSLGGEAPAPEMGGGDANPELDAAAAALDDMGAASAEAPEAPDAAMGGEPAPDAGLDAMGGDDAAMGGDPMGGEGDAAVKDIEKLTGKVTQKIRTATLTPEMSKGLLKSFITSFDEKLDELDHEDKKELAAAIMKEKSDEDMGISDTTADAGNADAGSEIGATTDDEEKEIEETINQHLAEMGIGINESDVNIEGSAESSDTKPFKEFVKSRGYNPERVDEISLMEMVSLVNGYTNECGDAIDQADVHGLSEFVTSEVSAKVAESGNSLFENLMKPFGEKIKKNKKAYATESVIPTINENFGDDEGEEEEEDDAAETAVFGADKEEGGADDAAAISVSSEEPAEIEEPAEEPEVSAISIAPAGETLAAGTPGGSEGSKSVTVDLNNNTINMTLNESTKAKLEKIVKKKIEEALSGKKSPINESKKSALSIMIDELVNEAIVKRRNNIEKALLRPRS